MSLLLRISRLGNKGKRVYSMGAPLPPSHYLLGFPSPSVSPCHQPSSVYLPLPRSLRRFCMPPRPIPFCLSLQGCAVEWEYLTSSLVLLKTACHPTMQTIPAVPQLNKKLLTPNLRHTLRLSPVYSSSSSSWHCIVPLSLLSLSGTTLRDANGNEGEERRRLWSRVKSSGQCLITQVFPSSL